MTLKELIIQRDTLIEALTAGHLPDVLIPIMQKKYRETIQQISDYESRNIHRNGL